MKLVKRNVWAGVTLDQEVMIVSDPKDGDIKKARPKLRFKTEEERAKHRRDRARQAYIRKFNATFQAGDSYDTLTFDNAHEVHTFAEARRIRNNLYRRLQRACPEAIFTIVMGRGETTNRIHFHLVAHGLPEEVIWAKWKEGLVLKNPNRLLREHNYYPDETGRKIDHGQDFRGLASYMFDHWTEEQGGHYTKCSRNMRQPEPDDPEECEELYTDKYPPQAPEGYLYIGCDATPFGYVCYHYIWAPKCNGQHKQTNRRRE